MLRTLLKMQDKLIEATEKRLRIDPDKGLSDNLDSLDRCESCDELFEYDDNKPKICESCKDQDIDFVYDSWKDDQAT